MQAQTSVANVEPESQPPVAAAINSTTTAHRPGENQEAVERKHAIITAVPKSSRPAWVPAVLILATLLGSIAVPLAFKARENLWDKFPSLAEKAAAILAADTSVVYFRTQDGEVYRCSVENHLPCSKVPPDAETTVRSSVASYINQPPGVYDLVMATTTLLVPQVLALCLLVMPKKHRLIDTNLLQSTIGA